MADERIKAPFRLERGHATEGPIKFGYLDEDFHGEAKSLLFLAHPIAFERLAILFENLAKGIMKGVEIERLEGFQAYGGTRVHVSLADFTGLHRLAGVAPAFDWRVSRESCLLFAEIVRKLHHGWDYLDSDPEQGDGTVPTVSVDIYSAEALWPMHS